MEPVRAMWIVAQAGWRPRSALLQAPTPQDSAIRAQTVSETIMRHLHLILGLAALGAIQAAPASALSMQECSAKYQEAKKAGGKLN